MLIRTKLALNLAVQLALVGLLALALQQLHASYEALETTQRGQIEGLQLVNEVRQSSDELTQMARLFVVTREPRYAEYFREIARIRDGVSPRPPDYDAIYWDLVRAKATEHGSAGRRQALLDRLRLSGFRSSEFALLDEAKLRSDALIKLEDMAMGLIDSRRSNSNAALSEEEWRQSLGLMHGETYLNSKADIMLPLRQFSALVETRLGGEREAAQEGVRRSLLAVLVALLALAAHALVSALSFDRSVRRPVGLLRGWAEQVRAGRLGARTRLGDDAEFGELSRVVDEMAETSERAQMELKDEFARRARAEDVVQHLANHDALTSLPSLRLLHDRLERALSLAQRKHQGLAVLVLGLRAFKPVNEQYGHDSGDVVLKAIAQRLQGALREADTVGRFGGDEFLVILPDVASAETATQMKAKLASLVSEPLYLAQHHVAVHLSAAIGVASYPSSATDMHGLLRQAEQDMKADKADKADTMRDLS